MTPDRNECTAGPTVIRFEVRPIVDLVVSAARDLEPGEPLRMSDVDLPTDSVLLRLRRLQDAHFHP